MRRPKGSSEPLSVMLDDTSATEGQLEQQNDQLAEARVAVQRLRDLQFVSDVWLELANEGLDALLQGLLQRLKEILGADTATILLVTDGGSHLAVRAAVGGQEEVANQVEVPMGRGFAGRIAAERQPMIVADVRAAEVQSPFLRKRVRSLVGTPLIVEDRVIGVLHVGSVDRARFTSEDLQFLRLVGDRAAIAIENARLYESEQRAREAAEASQVRLAFLAEAGTVLAGSLSRPEALESLCRLAVAFLADLCLIDLVDSDGSIRRMAAVPADSAKAELAQALRERYPPGPDSRVPAVRVIRTGRPEFSSDVSDAFLRELAVDEEHLAILLELGVDSWVCVPLLARDRVMGAVTLLTTKSGKRFDAADMSLAEELARRAAMAIENAGLYEAEQRARELAEEAVGRAAVLQSVTAALSEALTPDEAAGVIVERGVPALGASAGAIGLRRNGEIEVVRAVGYHEEFLEPWRRFPLDAPLPLAEAARSGESVFIGSKEERDARYPHLRSSSLTGDQAWAAVPLTVEGKTLGAMGLSFAEARTFDERDRGLMIALARQAAQAIERARLFEAERIARGEAESAGEALAFLSEGSRMLAASLEFQPTLEQVAGLAVPFLADICFIDLVDETGSIRRVASSHADPPKEDLVQALRRFPPSLREPDHPILDVLRTGTPKLLEEVPHSMRSSMATSPEQLLGALSARSVMIVPLVARGRTLGAMTFVLSGDGRTYGDEQLRVAQDLAGRAALAIDNARLFRDQRHIATALQRSLLPPSLPSVPGLEVAGRYRAAGEGIEVGGDFFDLFEAGDEEWAVVIGDVCGKGPEAAAVTGLARHTLRAAAMHEHRPSRLLRILNDAILRQVREDRFCTICYARLRPNPAGTRVTLSSGGHPLPLVLRRDGSLELAGQPGSLLGVFHEPELPDHVVDLLHGEVMVLYTDGLVEVRGEPSVVGEERLGSVLTSSAGLDAESIAERIEEAVLEHGSAGLRDDLAYIVLRVMPE